MKSSIKIVIASLALLASTHVVRAASIGHETWHAVQSAESAYLSIAVTINSQLADGLAADRTARPSDNVVGEANPGTGTDVSGAVDGAVVEDVAGPLSGTDTVVESELADSAQWQLLNPPYTAQTPLPVSGKAMYYNPGVMKTVIESRTRFEQIDPCAECIGYVAMLRRGDLDRRVWLQVDRWRVEGPFHVIDVAATKHVGQLLRREWIVDVDYRTAQRWGFRMPWVTVWDHPPLDVLLATDSVPLEWDRCVAPSEAFTRLPQSVSVPESALLVHGQLLKTAIDLRQMGAGDFVDVLTGVPEELPVK